MKDRAISFIRNNWIILSLSAIIFAIYTVCVVPGLSWVGYDCDLGDFLYSAKFASNLHFPGYPIYSMLSWFIIRIPIGSEPWRMAFFLSTIPSIITCILVYLVVKKQTTNKWAPYVATLALAGANIFFMQCIVVEMYSMSAMLATATYTCIIYKKYRLAAIFGGLTCSMHWLAIAAIIFFMMWKKEFRRKWKYIISFFLVPYIYILVMGIIHPSLSMISGGFWGFVQYVFGTLSDNMQWWLNIAIWQVPMKVLQTIALFCVAFGLALIPMIKYIVDWKNSKVLLAAFIIPFLYFFGCNASITIHHLMIVTPFFAIAAGLGLSKVKVIHPAIICAISLIMLVMIPCFYNIGTNLDKDLSAQQIYNSFSGLSNKSIIVDLYEINDNGNISLGSLSGREATLLDIYDRETGRNICMINIESYCYNVSLLGLGNIGAKYREKLKEDYGIETPFIGNVSRNTSKLSSSNVITTDVVNMYWKNVELISEDNPSYTVYCTMIFADNPFEREYVVYESKK
jgi:hypothetical protein